MANFYNNECITLLFELLVQLTNILPICRLEQQYVFTRTLSSILIYKAEANITLCVNFPDLIAIRIYIYTYYNTFSIYL